jgi:hypothetical protein
MVSEFIDLDRHGRDARDTEVAMADSPALVAAGADAN